MSAERAANYLGCVPEKKKTTRRKKMIGGG